MLRHFYYTNFSLRKKNIPEKPCGQFYEIFFMDHFTKYGLRSSMVTIWQTPSPVMPTEFMSFLNQNIIQEYLRRRWPLQLKFFVKELPLNLPLTSTIADHCDSKRSPITGAIHIINIEFSQQTKKPVKWMSKRQLFLLDIMKQNLFL